MVFVPKFVASSSIAETADRINRPHEDYPRRVGVTEALIHDLVDLVQSKAERAKLGSHEIKSLHSEVMWDLEMDRGTWRTCNVMVGGDIPPEHFLVEEKLSEKQLLVIERSGWAGKYPHIWYKEFEEIHPFRDGNGRVGGMILAFLTYDPETKTMLAPCQ